MGSKTPYSSLVDELVKYREALAPHFAVETVERMVSDFHQAMLNRSLEAFAAYQQTERGPQLAQTTANIFKDYRSPNDNDLDAINQDVSRMIGKVNFERREILMHPEAYAYVQLKAGQLDLTGKRVLEIGAKNINGSVRPLFAAAKSYHGIDAAEGPDVDEAIDAKDFDGAHKYDVVVSCEVLEHEAKPQTIIACAERALKPGGLLILTAAGDDRAPHSAVDGGPLQESEYYGNITQEQLAKLLRTWTDVQIHTNDIAHDIYATAVLPKPAKSDNKE